MESIALHTLYYRKRPIMRWEAGMIGCANGRRLGVPGTDPTTSSRTGMIGSVECSDDASLLPRVTQIPRFFPSEQPNKQNATILPVTLIPVVYRTDDVTKTGRGPGVLPVFPPGAVVA